MSEPTYRTIIFSTPEEKQILNDIKEQVLDSANFNRAQEYIAAHPEAAHCDPLDLPLDRYTFSRLVIEALRHYLDGALY